MAQEPTGVIDAILAAYDSLSPAERRVAGHILHNRGEASGLDASELARRAEASAATVTRFVRSVGYPSYATFRLALAREEHPRDDHQPGSAISMDDVSGSLAYVASHKVDELRACANSIDPEVLAACARLIRHSNTIVFAGIGTSLSFAQLAAFRFSQFGIRAISPSTESAMAPLATSLGPGDCVVMCSNSGDSRRLRMLMDICGECAVPTAVLTANPSSDLLERADVGVTFPIYDHMFADDFIFSISSMNFVVESLLLLLLHDSADASGYLQKVRNISSVERRNVHFTFAAPQPASDGSSNP